MSDIKKFQLMAEAAIAVAASDGLEDTEIDTVRNIVLNVTFMSNEIKSFFDAQGIDHNNINFDEFGEAYDYIVNKDIVEFESIEVNQEYCDLLIDTLENGPVLHTICLGMALAAVHGDGDYSEKEHESFVVLVDNLTLADQNIAGQICAKLLHNDGIIL